MKPIRSAAHAMDGPGRYILEALEPRVLLSSTPLPVGDGSGAGALNAVVVEVAQATVIPAPQDAAQETTILPEAVNLEVIPDHPEAESDNLDGPNKSEGTPAASQETNLAPGSDSLPSSGEQRGTADLKTHFQLHALGDTGPEVEPIDAPVPWLGGDRYVWEINDVDAGAGTGWDLKQLSVWAGQLEIDASVTNKFIIDITSLDPGSSPGPVADFDATKNYQWTILNTVEGIRGFDRNKFDVQHVHFANSIGAGEFVIDMVNADRDIVIRYVPHTPFVSFDQPTWVEQGPTRLEGNHDALVDGPYKSIGAIQSISFAPANSRYAFVGAVSGGVWFGDFHDPPSTPTWVSRSNGLGSLSIGALAVSPFNLTGQHVGGTTLPEELVLLAGTGSFSSSGLQGGVPGLFLSRNGGQDWEPVGVGVVGGGSIRSIIPTEVPGLIFVTSDTGLYRSLDGGLTWEGTDHSATNPKPLPQFDQAQDFIAEVSNAQSTGVATFYVSTMNAGSANVYRAKTTTPAEWGAFVSDGSFKDLQWQEIDTGTTRDTGLRSDADRDGRYGETAEEDSDQDGLPDPGKDLDGDGHLDIDETLGNANRIRLSANADGIFAAVILNEPSSRLGGVFSSIDEGDTWTPLELGPLDDTNPGGFGDNHFAIVADDQHVYIGGTVNPIVPYGIAYRWDAPPNKWTVITSITGAATEAYKTAPHGDIRNMVLMPKTSGHTDLYAVSDGGLYRLTDADKTQPDSAVKWEFLSVGMGITEITHSVAYDHVTQTILAGTQDNGVIRQKTPGSTDWETLTGGDGNYVGVGYMPVDPLHAGPEDPFNSIEYYMANNLGSFTRQEFSSTREPGAVERVEMTNLAGELTDRQKEKHQNEALNNSKTINDNGTVISSDRDSAGEDKNRPVPFAVNPELGASFVAGRIYLYHSANEGSLLDHNIESTPGADQPVTAVAYGSAETLYLARGNTVYGAVTQGATKLIKGDHTTAGFVTDIVIDPTNPAAAFAITDGDVYYLAFNEKRTELTVTELIVTAPMVLPLYHSISAVVVDGRVSLLLGGTHGVYRADIEDPGQLTHSGPIELQQFGVGLPNITVTDIVYDEHDDLLVIGTLGRGIWKMTKVANALGNVQTLHIDTGAAATHIDLSSSSGRLKVNFNGTPFWPAGQEPDLATIKEIRIQSGDANDTLSFHSNSADLITAPIIWDASKLSVTDNDRLEFDGTTREPLRLGFVPTEYVLDGQSVLAEDVENIPLHTDADQTELVPFAQAVGPAADSGLAVFNKASQVLPGAAPFASPQVSEAIRGDIFVGDEPVSDEEGPAPAPEPAGEARTIFASVLHRLLEDGTGFQLSDIGTRYNTAGEIQDALDGLDTIDGNVTVVINADGTTGRIILGDPTDATKPFKRTLSVKLPVHESLLGGSLTLDGTFEMLVDVEVLLEFGVDSSGFYLRTDLSATPELRLTNLRLSEDSGARAKFGFLLVDISDPTLAANDTVLKINLIEPDDPFGIDRDGKIRLYELGADALSLFAGDVVGDPNDPDLTFTANVQVAPLDPDGEPLFKLNAAQVSIVWDDVKDPTTITLKATTPGADPVFKFLNLDGNGMSDQLKRLLDVFEAVRGVDFMQLELPFAGGITVGDAVDFVQAFKDAIFAELYDVCVSANLNFSDPTSNILLGRLSADAHFTVVIGDESYDITVAATSTNTGADINNTVLDLAQDINEALDAAGIGDEVRAAVEDGQLSLCLSDFGDIRIDGLANDPFFAEIGFTPGQVGIQVPKFGSLQELIVLLEEELRVATGDRNFELNVGYDSGAQEFSFSFYFTDQLLDKTATFSYDPSLGLGPIANVSANGTFTISSTINVASPGAQMTLGVQLGALSSPQLNASALVPAPSNGRLSADAVFDLVLNYGDVTGSAVQNGRIHLVLPKTTTDNNVDIAGLLGDLDGLLTGTVTIGGTSYSLSDLLEFVAAGPTIALRVKGEDLDGDGRLDLGPDTNNDGLGDGGEDTNGDHLLTVPNLNVITAIDIEADLDNPIVTELGFAPGTPAKSIIKGITLKNAKLSGDVTITGRNLGANVKFSVFEISTSNGTADGSVIATATLQNPTDATKSVNLGELLADVGNITNYLKPGFGVTGSFDLVLNDLTLTPDLDLTDSNDSVFEDDAYFEVFIPNLNDLNYNANVYDITDPRADNDSGIFVRYPEIGPVGNFNCMTFAAIISVADDLVDDLETLRGFSFLGQDLPLINISLGDILDMAGDLARFFAGLASGDVDTINTLEADLKSFFGLPANSPLIDLTVQDATPAPTTGGATGKSSTHFNPHGLNNALLIEANEAGEAWDGFRIEFTDPGTYGTDDTAVVNYDAIGKRISVSYNTTHTTAKELKRALESAIKANWTVTYDNTATTGDPAPVAPAVVGDGVITITALKFSIQYSLAYGDFKSFQFNVDDLLNAIPNDPTLQALLGGVGSLVDLEGSANLNVTASADLRLDFGIDVSNPCNWLPFLYDTTGITLAAAIRGTNLDFTASLGGLGIFVKDGTATLDRDGDPDTVGDGEDTAFSVNFSMGDDQRYYFREGIDALLNPTTTTVGLEGAFTLDLPLCFPTADFPLGGSSGDNNGDGNPDNNLHIHVSCLDDFLTAIVTPGLDLDPGCFQIESPDLNDLFGQFNPCDLVANSPLLLDGLDALLGAIQDALNNAVLNRDLPLIGTQLSKAADVIGQFREGLLADIREKLTEAGDPIGLVKEAIWNVLGKPGLDILVDAGGNKLTSFDQVSIVCNGDTLDFDLHLGKTSALVDTTANPLKFDIGLPGFGLKMNGNVVVEIGFSFHLHFAISASDGFYLVTDDPGDELQVFFQVSLPGLSTTGELFFLQLDVVDDSSSFIGSFSVDIKDPIGQGKLTVGDVLVSPPSAIVSAKLVADAELHLDIIVSFAGSAVFPRILTDFDLSWKWTLNGDPAGDLTFGFNNLYLDLGSFVSKFLLPILTDIKSVTDPLQPVIDVLTAPLPILSDLAGADYTLLDLAERFGLLKPGTKEFIEAVLMIADLVNSTSVSDDGSILVPLGNLNLVLDDNGEVIHDPFEVLSDLPPDLTTAAAADVNTQSFIGAVEEGGFQFPFLKPSELVKLFLGQPVSLLEYRAPKLEFSASFEGKVPIFPPLYVVFGGQIGATIDLTFGYDTYGLQKFFSDPDKNIADLAEGFYVKDRDDNGHEITELTLTGGLTAGAELNVLIAEAGVQGGIFAAIDFDLRDPNEDGKVRLAELAANFKEGPLCIFDVHGRIYAALQAFLKIHTFIFGDIDKTWTFAEITLLEFDIKCPQPVLASLNEGTGELLLHIGENAALRENGDTTDGDEHFIVRDVPDESSTTETVEVSFGGITQSYPGVKSIRAFAGKGNDIVDLLGVESPAEIHGGDGNDTLYAGRGENSSYYGDAGDDTITAEQVADDFDGVPNVFYGGTGNDTLTGGNVDDQLYGEAGNDTIYGDNGNDTLDGGDGNDVIYGSFGDDKIFGGNGTDRLYGEDGADKIAGDLATVNSAGSLSDSGGSGDDTIQGGPGDDWLIGGAGNDTMDGEDGNDILLGDKGTIVTLLKATGIDGSGNDVMAGGGGADVLFGAGGNDSLFGGAFLNSGSTEIVEADGADFLDGGDGNDSVFADDAHSAQATTFAGASIGDFVWFDLNGDNLQNEGEPGVAGVTVQLYDGATATLGATTTTNVLGAFTFTGLAEGDYYLKFTLPAGLIFVDSGVGDDEAVDSDPTNTGKTATFHVETGQQDLTRDAGVKSTVVTVSIADAAVAEGDLGLTNASFVVTLSAPSDEVVTVAYRTVPGIGSTGAQRLVDYSSVNYTLVFAPGVTTQTILVPIQGDLTDEPDETFSLILSDAFEGINPITLSDSVAVGTIVDDDDPPVVSVADGSVVELDTADSTLNFTVSLSNPSWQSIKIDYFTTQMVNSDGTLAFDAAVSGVDYENTNDLSVVSTGLPGITIPAGETTATIPIKVNGDDLDEYDEHFGLAIRLDAATPDTAAVLGDNAAIGTILDDNVDDPTDSNQNDPLPFVSLEDGDRDKTIAQQNVPEGHAGNTPVQFTLTLDKPSGRSVTIDWNTNAGTAFTNEDFVDDYQTVTFAPGETSKTMTAQVVGDTVDEGEDLAKFGEKFFINIIQAQNAQIGTSRDHVNHAVVTIVDDDEGADAGPWYVQYSSPTYTVSEHEAYATITLVRAGGSSEPVAVYWTVGGTAKSGRDYIGIHEARGSANRELVRFDEGETTKTFQIQILNDSTYEGDRTVDLYLANPTGGPVQGVISHAVLTILEDDPLPEVSIDDVTVNESDGSATFTVSASGSTSVPIVVNWTAVDGPAVEPMSMEFVTLDGLTIPVLVGGGLMVGGPTGALANQDYKPASGTITIPAFSGDWPVDPADGAVKIKIIKDTDAENEENFAVKLTLDDPSVATLADAQGVGTIEDDDPVVLKGRVFYDVAGDGLFDLNVDYGLPNLSIKLSEGETVLDTTTTDANGSYAFTQPVGDYTITVDETDADFPVGGYATAGSNPLEYSLTLTAKVASDIGFSVSVSGIAPSSNIGNGSSFSNDTAYGGGGNDVVNGGNGDDWLVGGHWLGPGCSCDGTPYDATLTEELTNGIRTRIYVTPTTITANKTISGHVWLETGADNQNLSGEAGIANIQVNLFDDSWMLIATTYTDTGGNYSFETLTPCKYVVQFLPPAGYAFATPNQGTGPLADNTDSDPAVDTGLTAQYDLTGTAILIGGSHVDAGLKALPAGSAGPWSLQFGQVIYSARETDKTATITITRTANSTEPIGVYYTTDGTATLDQDYKEARGTIHFGDGENEKAFVVSIISDDLEEGYETVLLTLKNPTGGDVTGNLPTAVLLIFDNPCPDDDLIRGGDGNDVLLGDFGYFKNGQPIPLGGMGNDSLFGDQGDDSLYGEGGDDLIEGGTGKDTLVGGGENDTYRFDGDVLEGDKNIQEDGSPFGGNDAIDLSSTSTHAISLNLADTAPQPVTKETVGTTETVLLWLTMTANIENITGGALGDTLAGNGLNNILIGGGGDDTLIGNGGDDDLDGGSGSDTYPVNANTSTGHIDIFEGSNVDSDTIDFNGTTAAIQSLDLGVNTSQKITPNLTLTINTGSAGVAVSRFGVSLVLFNPLTGEVVNSAISTGIENLYGGSGNDHLTGNTRDNIIWGREGKWDPLESTCRHASLSIL